MKLPTNINAVIDRTRYSVATATLIADDTYWDGHNHERSGRNTFLYRTARGSFFVVHMTMWQDEHDSLEPVTLDDAIELYEGPLSEHHIPYAEAFPTVTVQDA